MRQLLLGGTALTVLLTLHCLPSSGGVDPVTDLLSEYQLRSVEVGAPYAAALLCADAAAALIGVALARRGLLRGRRATGLLVLWCASLLGLTVFLKDPIGAPATWYGTVHLICTVANFASLPALGALLWWQHRASPHRRAGARALGLLAAASVICAAPLASAFLLHSGGAAAIGLVERTVVLIDVAMLATLAGWSRA